MKRVKIKIPQSGNLDQTSSRRGACREKGLEFGARIRRENGVDARDTTAKVKRRVYRYDLLFLID